MPGSLWHVRIHGYRYIEPTSGEELRGKLLDVDIAIYGFLFMNSDMRRGEHGGTGMTDYFSAASISEGSRDSDGERTWSIGTVQRSLRRLQRAGFLVEKSHVHHSRRVRLFDPFVIPSRRRAAEKEVNNEV